MRYYLARRLMRSICLSAQLSSLFVMLWHNYSYGLDHFYIAKKGGASLLKFEGVQVVKRTQFVQSIWIGKPYLFYHQNQLLISFLYSRNIIIIKVQKDLDNKWQKMAIDSTLGLTKSRTFQVSRDCEIFLWSLARLARPARPKFQGKYCLILNIFFTRHPAYVHFGTYFLLYII